MGDARPNAKPVGRTYSTRYDVQAAHEALFYDKSEAAIDQSSRYNSLAFEDFDDRADGIEMLKRRLRAAGRKHLAKASESGSASDGWGALFQAYDLDGNGELDLDELSRAVRRDLKIPEHDLSTPDLARLFCMIDADDSGTISAEELVEFMRWESRVKQRSGHALALQAGDTEGAQQGTGYVVPFVAEYFVLKRMTLREGAELTSRKIAMVSAGEIVAVTRTHGNRLRCERLTFGVMPRSGWCSEYAEGGSGEQLLEMLPRAEWGDGAFNDTAIASRVSALRSAERLRAATGGVVERDLGGSESFAADGSAAAAGLMRSSSTYWEQHSDETRAMSEVVGIHSLADDQDGFYTARGAKAAQSLCECRSEAEVEAALALLEATPRDSWDTALRTKPPRRPRGDPARRRQQPEEESSSFSGDGWVMSHPTPERAPLMRRNIPMHFEQEQSAALSEKALAVAAQLEAIAASLRAAGVRADLVEACEMAKRSSLGLATRS